MDLKTYLQQPGAPSMAELARRAGIKHVDQLRQWRDGTDGRRPSPAACADLERATAGEVTCEELRADLPWLRVKDRAWLHPKGRPVLDVAAEAS